MPVQEGEVEKNVKDSYNYSGVLISVSLVCDPDLTNNKCMGLSHVNKKCLGPTRLVQA